MSVVMRGGTLAALVLALMLGGSTPTEGQWPPDSIYNLQVLPEDMPVRQIVGIMRGFAGGLGVRCIYCHVGDDPNDLASTEFGSDEKETKRKAREMLRMVQAINNQHLPNVPNRSDPPVEVTCATCHHGVTKPVQIQDILTETAIAAGVDSAIAEYQSLREEYYGSYSYDFRNFILANVAENIARRDADGAIKLLEFNVGLFPQSTQTYLTWAQIEMSRGDTTAAITAFERGLEVDPSNTFFRRAIEQLRGR